jgi:hypothetical protein
MVPAGESGLTPRGMIDGTTKEPNETTGPNKSGHDDRGKPRRRTVAGPGAAYLRVAEAELGRIAGSQGMPGRRIGFEWRFSRAAIQDWLRRPSMKESLLRLAGSWKHDPYLDEMLEDIYRQRGRPMSEEGK